MVLINGKVIHCPDELTDDDVRRQERIMGRPLTRAEIYDALTWADTEDHRDAWTAAVARNA